VGVPQEPPSPGGALPGIPEVRKKQTISKENIMTRKTTFKHTRNRLRHAVCAFGLLISIAALPAYGQQVHQLSYDGSNWMDQSLNGSGPTSDALAAFATMPNDQAHVYYAGSGENLTFDVHQLFYNGVSWSDEDLTVLSGGAKALNGTVVTGFSVGNYQYVYYVSDNNHLHQLLYDNYNWTDSDLTAQTGGPQVSRFNLVAFTTTPAVHVYYMELADFYHQHIHQMFNTNGSNWQDQDLTNLTGGASGNVGIPFQMAGFNIGNFQYVYFLSDAAHIHELVYNNSSWSDEDLTALTKTSTGYNNCYIAALVIPGTKKMRVYYVTPKLHLSQLASTNNKKWTNSDLTKKTKGPLPTPYNQIIAFTSGPKNQVNVYYGSGTDVNRLFQPTPTTWSNEDLTVLTNGGTLDDFGSAFAGFSLQNNQYVYYMAD
jgi:hypothetical protein